jgi:branched-subunit amino acid ABC-type transport system permease component
MSFSSVVNIIINGLLMGGVYGLFASGFTFQLGCLSIYNFSFGNWLILAMYLTFFSIKVWNIGILAMIVVLFIIFFIVGYAIRRFILEKGTISTHIISTIGIGMLLNGIILITFTARPRSFEYLEPMYQITPNIRIGLYRLLIFVLAGTIMIGFQIFLKKTTLGKTIRAVTERYETSKLMGINSSNIINIAFGISFILIAISGMMLMTLYPVTFGASDSYQLMSFLIASLAGLGNIRGAFFSGLIVGVLSSLISLFVSSFGNVIFIVIIIIFLVIRPQGLFAKKSNM